MTVPVQFWSYFVTLAGVREFTLELPEGSTVDTVLTAVYQRYPRLGALRNSTLVAVGLEYVGSSDLIRDGVAVSLFPPVQGG